MKQQAQSSQSFSHNINLSQNSQEADKLNEDSPMLQNHVIPTIQISPDEDLGEPKATYSYLKSYFVSMLQPSDNKLAMKLFGSKKGVLKEKLRQQEVSRWVIHPCSNFRFGI
jgi:hypothetical protein